MKISTQVALATFTLSLGTGVFLATADAAQAASLTWVLNGFSWSDGTTATGQFDYDADTNTYSNINITVANTSGMGLMGFPFPTTFSNGNLVSPPGSSADTLSLCENGDSCNFGDDFLSFEFTSDLTNSGGIVSTQGFYGFAVPFGTLEVSGQGVFVSTTNPTPVPAPSALVGLLSTALLAGRRLKRLSIAG